MTESNEYNDGMVEKLLEYKEVPGIVKQLRPFSLIYRFLNVFPIIFANDRPVYCLLFLFCPFIVFGALNSYVEVVPLTHSTLIEMVRNTILPLITIFVSAISSTNYVPLIENIQRYDEEFKHLWIVKRHHRVKGARFIWISIVFFNFYIYLPLFVDVANIELNQKTLQSMLLCIAATRHLTVLTFFLMFCNELKLRFMDLNESFVSFMESSYKYSPEDFLQRSFEKYRLMHFKLTNNCVRLANKMFGNQILCCYIMCVINTVTIFYFIGLSKATDYRRAELIFALNCVAMFLVPVLCDGLTKASSDLVTDLFMIPISDVEMKTKLQITMFVHEVTLNRSVMSANGYFELRKPFVATWFGLLVSGMVVLIQRLPSTLASLKKQQEQPK